MAAVELHAEAGDLLADVGEERLDDRDQQRGALAGGLARGGVGVAVLEVELARGVGPEHAATFGEGLLGQQHAPHVRVIDDRVGRLVRLHRAGQAARLQALAGIAQAALERRLGDAQALQADLEARVVHHGEHAGQALVGLADQPAGGAVEVHHAGRGALDAHLVLDGAAGQRVLRAQAAVSVDDEFRHQQQADALHPGRRVGQTGEHQVDDVVGEVLLAAADEDLAAADGVAAVGLRFGAGAQQREVGAGLRLGEAHGAGPFAADHLGQVALLEFVAAVLVQGQHGALGEPGVDAEGQRGGHQHLVEARRDQLREALAAELQRAVHARPAVVDELPVGFAEAVRGGHLAVLEHAALFVGVAIQRRDHLAGVARGFFQHAVDQLAVEAVAERGAVGGDVEQFVEDEAHVAQGGLVAHARPSSTSARRLPLLARCSISAAGFQWSPNSACKRSSRSRTAGRPWASAQLIGPPTAAGKP
ncbi:hypothetical protein FQZ97_594480 [compost metagenome]